KSMDYGVNGPPLKTANGTGYSVPATPPGTTLRLSPHQCNTSPPSMTVMILHNWDVRDPFSRLTFGCSRPSYFRDGEGKLNIKIKNVRMRLPKCLILLSAACATESRTAQLAS